MFSAEVVQGSGAADAFQGGSEPQGHQDAGVDGGATRTTFNRADEGVQGRQIESQNELPHDPRLVIGGQQVLQEHGRD